MKNFKRFLTIGLIILCAPICVNAETFTDGDKTYNLEELNLSCAGDRDFYGMDEDNNYIFLEYDYDNGYYFIKATKDNQCMEMSNQEILDVLNNYSHEHYSLDINSKEIYKNIFVEEMFGYKKITVEEYDENEQYYTYDSIEDAYEEVETNDIDDVDSYYKIAYFGAPESAKLDTNISYYEVVSGLEFKKLTITDDNKQQIENNIAKYYVEKEQREKTSVVGTISDKVAQILSDPDFVKVDVIGTEDPNRFYFLVINSFDPYPIYSLYDQDGDLLFENMNDFSYLNIGLFSVGRGDKAEFYNLDAELIYTNEEIISFYEAEYKDGVSMLDGSTGNDFSYYNLSLQTGTLEPNPETIDSITSIIILGAISLIGFFGATIYLKKQQA